MKKICKGYNLPITGKKRRNKKKDWYIYKFWIGKNRKNVK
jgi:hypothetical protein